MAGGLTDGSICLWNPAKVLRSPLGSTDEGAGGAAVATLRKHTGPVKGLEFNASSPNLLASGSTDGDLIIWDVAQPSAPASYQLVSNRSEWLHDSSYPMFVRAQLRCDGSRSLSVSGLGVLVYKPLQGGAADVGGRC